MLLSRDLGDFAGPICKSGQMCAWAIYCGRATKFQVWEYYCFIAIDFKHKLYFSKLYCTNMFNKFLFFLYSKLVQFLAMHAQAN